MTWREDFERTRNLRALREFAMALENRLYLTEAPPPGDAQIRHRAVFESEIRHLWLGAKKKKAGG